MALAFGAMAAALARRAADHPGEAPLVGAEAQRRVREADIAFYRRRVAADPAGAADRAHLAGLFLQSGRESGRPADFVRAGSFAGASLALRGGRNAKALLVLSSSLLALHRFAEARIWAESLVAVDPDQSSHRALLGEIQLELGDYPAARRTFGSLTRERANLAVAPRLARLEEIEGRVGSAHAMLVVAAEAARRRADLPLEQRAWFQLRVADIALRHGRLAEAERAIAAGLTLDPADARLLAARVRLAAQRRDWRLARRWGAEAREAGADIATLALIGDVHAALGDCGAAWAHWDEAEEQNRLRPEPYARQWTLFRLQHDVQLDSTRAILEAEIEDRPDALGWHLLALARRLTGDPSGALDALRRARAVGSGGTPLFHHEGRSLDPGLAVLQPPRDRCRARPRVQA